MDVKLKQWPSDFPKTFSKNKEIRKGEKYTNSDWREVGARPDLPTTFSKPFLFATFLNRTKSKMDVVTSNSFRYL